jgi:phosphomannomutase
MALMFSVSGLRGIVGKDLTPQLVYMYAAHFGRFLGPGTVVVGRDTRQSGPEFRDEVVKGLNTVGCSVIDIGIAPTPTVLYMVRTKRARGGIAITASHNPVGWNALKFASSKGRFLDESAFQTFSKRILGGLYMTERQVKKIRNKTFPGSIENHVMKIIDTLKLKKMRLRVGVDAVNGAGSVALPRVLEKAGCVVTRVNCVYKKTFSRNPEPTPENIRQLCRVVKEKRLDIGFACDPDCDRLSIVDDNGRAIGEDKTLVLAADYVLRRSKRPVVTNLSTTALLDYVAAKHGCRVFRTKVGEANVVSIMEKNNAVIGGEGNGGVIYPRINFTRDALVGAALVIKLMTTQKKRISRIADEYPRFTMVKKKMEIPGDRLEERKKKIIKKIRGKINLQDGLRITGKNYWLHIRPSQTEPLVRIIGEASSSDIIEQYVRTVITLLE